MTTATENIQQTVSDAAAAANGDHVFGTKAEQLKALVEELCSMVPDAVCAKEDCSQMLMDGKDKAMRAGKQALATVRNHPVETALIAVGVGLATWWLINRK
jgi:hypothetical protein